ncbi:MULTISPECIES: hypothetical protein [unclassified Arthrobacter]|uniref:hypothetical protein n=1 Tax=unclassified Arthrobacter TaxID=235627 RepID=UPI0021071374|nr:MULTISPECIES: hypothetical protein [unclassified Arthrobacter]MCQ1946523.1 hypothetical protein [Arthrobacter sp. zg-Y1116]MCQ1996005.1 hypothetical protein [Arthrobacter sp. zg-Y1171]UWX82922.1 hypothetical protein N2L00_05820 [Arthrobacter sp. zg-Y1171]
MPESQPSKPWPQTPVSTDDDAVDSVLDALDPLGAQPVAGHAAVYRELHDALLTELNTEPPAAPPAPGAHLGTAG